MEWTNEVPTKDGKYWWYGYYANNPSQPYLELVTIIVFDTGEIIPSIEGDHFYRRQFGKGKWAKFEEPTLPNLDDATIPTNSKIILDDRYNV